MRKLIYPESIEKLRELVSHPREAGGQRLALVLGAGKTGLAALELLTKAEFRVIVLDEKKISDNTKKIIDSFGGEFYDSITSFDSFLLEKLRLNAATFCIASPGIDPKGILYSFICEELELCVLSEVDFFVSFAGQPLVGVTGTNGKTTVVSMLSEMLGMEAIGNIGTSLLSRISVESLITGQREHDRVDAVLELSSYQLETSRFVSPHVAIWLNTQEDHLQRHGDMDSYHKAKLNLFVNQKENDWRLLNFEIPLELKKTFWGISEAKRLFFLPRRLWVKTLLIMMEERGAFA